MITKTSGLLALSLVIASARSFAATAAIDIVDFQFVPQTVTVNQGDTVQWTDKGTSIHTSTSDTGAWDSGIISPGLSFGRVFNTAGTFTYHCKIHPSMTGSIVVQNSPQPPPPQTPTQTGVGLNGSLLTIRLTAGVNAGKNADWWVVALAPSMHWYSYNYPNAWVDIGTNLSGVTPAFQGPLMDISGLPIFNTTGMPSGMYVIYFGVDTNMNGVLDFDQLYYSSFSLNAP